MKIVCSFSWLVPLMALLACPVYGQAGASLPAAEYDRWGSLSSAKLSTDGKWACFSMGYRLGNDTLFLANTSTTEKFSFPGGQSPEFIGNRYFANMDVSGNFMLTGLQGQPPFGAAGVASFASAGDYLILHKKTGQLLLLNDRNETVFSCDNISCYTLSPDKGKLVVCTSGTAESTVMLLSLDRQISEKVVAHANGLSYTNAVWNKHGLAFAFTGFDPANPNAATALYCYHLKKEKLYSLNSSVQQWPDGHALSPLSQMMVSDDAENVFLLLVPAVSNTVDSAPQVWNAKDKVMYPYSLKNGRFSSWARLYRWEAKSGKLIQVGDAEKHAALLFAGQEAALLFDPSANRPALSYDADRDLYIRDLKTGKTRLVLESFPGGNSELLTSPDGGKLAYFSNGNWWVYHLAGHRHLNLTAKLGTPFFDTEYDRTGPKQAYGCAGFTLDGNSLLLYDKFDIWEVHLDGLGAKKLTSGEKYNLIFRIQTFNRLAAIGFELQSRVIDSNALMVVRAARADFSGTCIYTLEKGRLELLMAEDAKLSLEGISGDGKECLVISERYDKPPTLVIAGANGYREIFQSNLHHDRSRWGRSELVEYMDKSGRKLKGALFFPFDYDPAKTYPMIVHIYERLSHNIHTYVNPSLYEAAGFNRTHYTANGYFVLCPDIAYTDGEPGMSALDCVTAATRAVLAAYPVSSSGIGLIGHSFGGYEVNFIISRSGLFSAAVSGNGIADLVSSYLSVSWSYGKPNTWRYENYQNRISEPFFENQEAYRANSPITFSNGINTPLLLWIGEKDTQVDPGQSYELHMALRRLGKENVLLVYPGEGHVLLQPKNQLDLSERIFQWFNTWLKKRPTQGWMKEQ